MQSMRTLLGRQSVRIATKQSTKPKPAIRYFSSTCICQKAIPKAPSTRRESRSPAARIRPERDERPLWEEALDDQMRPTVAHLKSGKKAGALDIEPEVAIQIIRSYCHVVKEPGWEARFCKQHNILPPTLTMLGMILQKNHVVHLRRLGDNLLICAATLGDLNAISRIVNRAFQAGKLDHPALLVPLTKLQFYANQGNVEAMVLYGRVLETKKKHDEAIEMFQRAAQFPRDPSTDSDVGEAFIQHGNILLGKGNKGDAKPYFKKAALEYDNAVGYSSLASLMSDEDPLKETYLLKAAASGIAEAGFQLAGFYHRTTELSAPLEKRQESKMITEKWLELGVFQGDEKSKAALKRLLDGEYSLDDESSSPQL